MQTAGEFLIKIPGRTNLNPTIPGRTNLNPTIDAVYCIGCFVGWKDIALSSDLRKQAHCG